jgi:hypothetical protein
MHDVLHAVAAHGHSFGYAGLQREVARLARLEVHYRGKARIRTDFANVVVHEASPSLPSIDSV